MTDHDVAKFRTEGEAPLLFVCEHASRHIPKRYGTLGLSDEALASHIAWDPGALDLAKDLTRRFDASLCSATISRLIYDLNRPPEATAATTPRSEDLDVPGNQNLSHEAREERIQSVYRPWRAALSDAIAQTRPQAVITVHSFTPVFLGDRRETTIGIVYDRDSRLADVVLEEAENQGRDWARNDPYGPEDGVTHTLQIARDAGLLAVMIEVRNDLLATPVDVAAQGSALTQTLKPALAQLGISVGEPQL